MIMESSDESKAGRSRRVDAHTQPPKSTSNLPDQTDEEEDVGENTSLCGSGGRIRLSSTAPPAPPHPRNIPISPHVFAAMSLLVFAFTVTTIPTPWYRVQQYQAPPLNKDTESLFFLFKTVHKVEGQADVVTHPGDYCPPVGKRVRALEAFVIASAVLSFITLMLAIAHWRIYMRRRMRAFSATLPPSTYGNSSLRTVTLVFSALTMACLTIAVSFNFNVYLWSFEACGDSFHSQLYEPNIGFGLVVTAWVLSVVGGIIAANDFTVPMDARTIDRCARSFALLSFTAMLFSVVASPIPHWYYKNGHTQRVTDILLWNTREHKFDWDQGNDTASISVRVGNLGCTSLTVVFRAAESFSIISIFFNACASVCGVLLWHDVMGTHAPAMYFSFLAVVTSIVLLALELTIFYGSWCGGKYAFSKHHYVLAAGFGLVAASLSIMLVASSVVTFSYHLTEKYFPTKRPAKTARQVCTEHVN